MISLDSIRFDATGCERDADETGARHWRTPAGDAIAVFLFRMPPDIDADLGDIDAVRARYRAIADQSGLGVIEIDTMTIAGIASVLTLYKAAQGTHGRTYIGCLTLPFRDFSFVLKVQCAEHGITGLRDTAVSMQLMQSREVQVDEDSGAMTGWLCDPYDPGLRGPMTRNRSETRAWDASFPEHPLSRARALLDHLVRTTQVSDEVTGSVPYSHRTPAPAPSRPWWRPW